MHQIDQQVRHIHLIGIGGIGVSGLAEMMLSRGYTVSGSDMKASGITRKLEEKGARVFIGHDSAHVAGADLVVYTAAVREDNPELAKARALGIRAINRAEMLGFLMGEYTRSLAVSGTHGKTTTTSMLSLMLEQGGLDPTMLIGGELKEINGNAKIGQSPYLVAEACEYKDSFLSFHPYGALILNVEEDHLDYFRDLEHIVDSFSRFTAHVPEEGFVVYNGDDPNASRLVGAIRGAALSFGLDTGCDCHAVAVDFNGSGTASFTLVYKGAALGEVRLRVPGIHNVYNALAAACAALHCGVRFEAVQESLSSFTGAKRRFEDRGTFQGARVVDDYAHHPTEIRATLGAAQKVPHRNIYCIFQPHTYTRTAELMTEFAACFGGADRVIITRIYAARETDTLGVHGSDLAERIRGNGVSAVYLDTFDEITEFLAQHAGPEDLILTVGAGNIDEVAERLTSQE